MLLSRHGFGSEEWLGRESSSVDSESSLLEEEVTWTSSLSIQSG